jgi:hypothetical protein
MIPWNYLVTLFSPDFYGNPVTRNDWFGHYAEWAGFFGVIPLVLAVYILMRKRSFHVCFFAFLGIFSLCLALPTPLLDLLVKLKIPVLATSAASRIICLFSFSGAILAGFGFDQLISDWDNKKIFKKTLVFLVIFIVFFLIIWGLILLTHVFPPDKLVIARRNLILPSGLFAAFALIALLGFWFKKGWRIIFSLALLFLVCFDLVRFASKWMPFDPRSDVYPKTPLIEFLAKETKGIDRVFGNFGTETQTYFKIPSVEGYDPLYIGRYGELVSTATEGKIGQLSRSTVYLNKNGTHTNKILDLLGVRYILHTIGDGRNIWAFPFWQWPDQFKLVYKDEKHEVYQNKQALPRVFLAYDYQVIKENQAIIDQMFAPDFNLAQTIILEEEPVIKLSGQAERNAVSFQKYTPTQIEIDYQSDKPGLLMLSDNYYPGWQASVDGQETKIYRADYSFRAIAVPAGNHQAVFAYEPFSFKLGLKISLLSLVIILLISGFTLIKKR